MSGALKREGKPISDAVITVSRTGRAFTTSTDGRGRFDFTDRMPPGKYAVIITGYGVSEKYASVATTDIAVSLGSGENVRDIALDSK